MKQEDQGLTPSRVSDDGRVKSSGGAEASPAVLALADAWASVDGKLEKYRRDDGSNPVLGYRDGYRADAATLIDRLATRGFAVVPLPVPPPDPPAASDKSREGQ